MNFIPIDSAEFIPGGRGCINAKVSSVISLIPNLIKLTDWHSYYVLPPGIHRATLEEIKERFATTSHRMHLFRGFRLGCESLVVAGCQRIYLDGSFTTSKNHPNDFDVCWDPRGVESTKVDAILLDESNRRASQKQKYFGEFIAIKCQFGMNILDFFQFDRQTGERKGNLLLD